MNRFEVHPIPAAEIRQLRSELLRPFETPDQLVYFGDDAPDTFLAGGFLDGNLIGIASVCRDPLPGTTDADVWRLRGMAVRPEYQGQGYGRILLASCIEHVAKHHGSLLWCNGRVSAKGFYQGMGFQRFGDVFEVPGTGPHYQFRRKSST